MTDPLPFRSRVILLGASNLTFAFPFIVHQLRRRLPAPMQVFSAQGHGRSYGIWSWLGVYGLPGIHECRLWEALKSQPPVDGPTLALVADVGNDLIYGIAPQTLMDWVHAIFERLQPLQCRLVVTRLPLQSALEMGDLRYRITKRLLFPGELVPWEEMKQRAVSVDQMLAESAASRGAAAVRFEREWFGIDRIHVRFRHQPDAWQRVFSAWKLDSPAGCDPSPLWDRARLWTAQPAEYRLALWWRRRRQPCVRWQDGSELWLF